MAPCLRVLLFFFASSAPCTNAASLFEDAERYLATFGVDAGLDHLEVTYTYDNWGRKEHIAGSEVAVSRVAQAPSVQWETPDASNERYCIVAISPDEPSRASVDGVASGRDGPYLHWFALNCKTDASSCYNAVPYEAPQPMPGTGSHRYIFILLRQTSLPNAQDILRKYLAVNSRQRWDLGGFLEATKGGMDPVAINFFYASADEDVQKTLRMKRPEEVPKHSAKGLGPGWDPKARPSHDEL